MFEVGAKRRLQTSFWVLSQRKTLKILRFEGADLLLDRWGIKS